MDPCGGVCVFMCVCVCVCCEHMNVSQDVFMYADRDPNAAFTPKAAGRLERVYTLTLHGGARRPAAFGVNAAWNASIR